MLEHAQAFLEWTSAHPGWALALLFAVAMLDAIFIVGAFVPASVVLFGMGALVALGSLELWPTALVAALGALAGDALSFWLGRRYGERLFEARALRRYPELIQRGRSFFDRHGGKGVWLARFLGPVRAVTPALAGASGMAAWLFLLADFSAAYLWALIYILPGVLFGASMGMAAEVATRLAGLLVLGFGIGALGVWLSRMGVNHLQQHAARWLGPLLDWSRRHRRLGRFGAALADPDQPETPVLLVVATVLMLFGGLWLLAFADAARTPYPSQLNALIYQTLHDLQTPWGNRLALAVAQLGDPWVYGPVAFAVLAALVVRRKQHAAAHWIAALAFGALISLGLHRVPTLPAPAAYFHGIGAALPRDLVMVVVIYGFMPVLLGTQRPPWVRSRAYAASTLLLSFIVLARLYLGVEWFSLTAFSLVVGYLWIGALGLGYRRHRPDRLFARGFVWPVTTVFVIAAVLRWWSAPVPPERLMPTSGTHVLATTEWWTGAYSNLPAQRVDLRGRAGLAFDLQWAGDLQQIEAALTAQGWSRPTSVAGGNLLRWLTTSSSVDQLPVLPQVHAGSHQRLSLRRALDGDRQLLLRLWPSGWQLDNGDPIWLGTLSVQRARTFYRLFRYPVPETAVLPDFQPPPPFEQHELLTAGGPLRLIAREPNLYTEPYADALPRAVRPQPLPPPPAPNPQ